MFWHFLCDKLITAVSYSFRPRIWACVSLVLYACHRNILSVFVYGDSALSCLCIQGERERDDVLLFLCMFLCTGGPYKHTCRTPALCCKWVAWEAAAKAGLSKKSAVWSYDTFLFWREESFYVKWLYFTSLDVWQGFGCLTCFLKLELWK